jgi:hypothetical protein
MACKVDSLPIV